MTQSYRDTGHSRNSRSRVVHVSTRSCLSGTSASWVFRSTGERANSCQCRGVGFSQPDSTPHPGTCSVDAELPQDFIRQDGGPTETLSEAPGAYGCSCGEVPPGLLHMRPLQHWLHGRVPRWAWKRGTHQVQITPACRKNLQPVDRSFVPSGRSAPGTGLQACCGIHGCLGHRLGSHVQRARSVRGMDGSPTALAYQLP